MKASLLPWMRQSMRVTWTIVVRGAGSILKFVMNILLGRVLGAEGAGFFFLFLSWSNVLGIVDSLGLPQYTLRSVAVLEEGDHSASRLFVSRALKLALRAGGVLAILPFILSSLLAKWLLTSSSYGYIIRAAALAGLGIVLLSIFTEALTGRGQVITAMQLESASIPLVMILFLGGAFLLGKRVPAEPAILVYLGGILLTILLARWFWLRRRQVQSAEHAGVPNVIPFRYPDLASFWGAGIVQVAANNLAILALPFFATPADIGRFGIAQRMATMSVTILDALANIFGPAFARQYARRNAAGLRHELLMSQVYSILAYLPFVAIFIFLAKPLLGVVGEDFIAARQFLMILMIGQLVNSATGLSGNLLNMAHRQHITFYVGVGQLALTAVLVYILASLYGALGVAIAVSATVAAKNLLFYFLAWRNINGDAKLWEAQAG